MKLSKPPYFTDIQQKARDRWKQLEQDPELAAPWHQLFKQVQNPRHVISELLQNADDAEATEVSIKIVDGIFWFEHNGRDFSADDFGSLCRFGYSNKRQLRTIGFRGIGFKSTFSLGNTVWLRTPTLMVAFYKKRFTLPVWMDVDVSEDQRTQIFVEIADDQRNKELLNSMQEWLNSSFSLLFFNHIRRLKLGDQDLNWKSLGPGPAADSEWMELQGQSNPCLIVRSPDNDFPEEALREIQDERLLDLAENASLPPCKVEIVLGAPGDVFVVLPTGVRTTLPFAINGPFVQDPARLKIKDPGISPTNQWLLQRIGQLAANATLQWLQHPDLDIPERAKAYDLLPGVGLNDNSLESICARMVGETSIDSLRPSPFLLIDDGSLQKANRCFSLPPAIWRVWTGEQIASILSEKLQEPRLLSNEISFRNQQKLQRLQVTISMETDDFLSLFLPQRPPQPRTWRSLLALWESARNWSSYHWKIKDLNILPVRGKNVLYSSKEVVRLGEKKLLQSEDDWDFLARYLLVLDVNWLRYLTEQRRIATEISDKELAEAVDAADQLLEKIDLDEPSNLDMVIGQVARTFFLQNTVILDDCVRFTQIAAKLRVKVGEGFYFQARDGVLNPVTKKLLFDDTGNLEELVPPEYRERLLLDEEYSQNPVSCSKEEWLSWVSSGNARLSTFIPLEKASKPIWGTKQIQDEVNARDYSGSLDIQYKSSEFEIDDWDFPQGYWDYWNSCAEEDPAIWGLLIEGLLIRPKAWDYARTAQAIQIAKNRSWRAISSGMLTPSWVLKFRELPCLRDTRGNYYRPAELMYRTPQTEPLRDVEPFVDAHLDFEASRPLLDLLGVRATPTGPRQILERISALAKAPRPPLLELAKWYQRLDALFDDCATEDQQAIRNIFHAERLIFTEEDSWQTSQGAFISSDENEAPGAALIFSEANHLSLWRKIGVNERPTVWLTIAWLKQLPSGEKIPGADIRRVKALLGRHPVQIWEECGHWLTLSGEWVPVENLQYCLTMQSLIRWTNLHEWVKERSADLTMLTAGLISDPPFSALPSLANQIEKRIDKTKRPGARISFDWLQTLGSLLKRIRLEDKELTARIRALADRLATTEGQPVERISILPYINDKPAGLPEHEAIVWVDSVLYVTDLPKLRLVHQISEILGNEFGWPELKMILAYSFERKEKEIAAYLTANYRLDPEEIKPPEETAATESALESEHVPVPSKEKREQPASPEVSEPDSKVEPEGEQAKTISTPPSAEADAIPPVEPQPEQPPRPPQVADPIPPAETQPAQPPKPAQVRISLIERFAAALGYHKNGSGNFAHPNGSSLVKSDGIFPWQFQEAGGTSRYYWPKEHCLQTKPLELSTEIWNLIESDPDCHSLILEDVDGSPIEMHGIDLLDLKENGTLRLYPAAYRLVLTIND